MKNLKSLLIVALIISFAFACKAKKDAVVKVGGEVVTTSDFKARMQEAAYYYNKDYVQTEQGKNQVLEGVIKETVMLSAARDKGYDKNEEFQTQLNNFVRQALITNLVKDLRGNELKITDEEVKAMYDKDKAYYDAPIQLKVAHILVLEEKDAESILKQLQEGVAFEVLASSASIDQSSVQNGGELNWFGKGDMVSEFEAASFALKNKGDISEIVKTTFGYHIVKKLDERQIPPIAFETVQNKLTRILEKQKFDNWYDSIKAKKRVKINKNKIDSIVLD